MSIKLTQDYGKGYKITNLKRFRQFYLCFEKGPTLSNYLNWSHYCELIFIKNENKRNYYINLCIQHNLSVRELRNEIKSNAYERLANLDFFFRQLGNGFTYVGHQYKISDGKNNYYIDILLFNIKLNCYVAIELKLRSLRKEDKAQIEFYMKLIDEQIKEAHHNKTLGIIITKESDAFIINFVRSENIIPLYYKLQKN